MQRERRNVFMLLPVLEWTWQRFLVLLDHPLRPPQPELTINKTISSHLSSKELLFAAKGDIGLDRSASVATRTRSRSRRGRKLAHLSPNPTSVSRILGSEQPALSSHLLFEQHNRLSGGAQCHCHCRPSIMNTWAGQQWAQQCSQPLFGRRQPVEADR